MVLATALAFANTVVFSVQALRIAFVARGLRLVFDHASDGEYIASVGDIYSSPLAVAISANPLDAGPTCGELAVVDVAQAMHLRGVSVEVTEVLEEGHGVLSAAWGVGVFIVIQ